MLRVSFRNKISKRIHSIKKMRVKDIFKEGEALALLIEISQPKIGKVIRKTM